MKKINVFSLTKRFLLSAIYLLQVTLILSGAVQSAPLNSPETIEYRMESISGDKMELLTRFSVEQLKILLKLNRCDLHHIAELESIVVPTSWFSDDLVYSPLPQVYPWAKQYSKAIVVHQPSQAFGAYESGRLVRWGPVSTGSENNQTPSGPFHLNWRSSGRHSTVNPDWYMPWYFNFQNKRGLSFHEYTLPCRPASHACIRLIERDAKWLFGWGEQWKLDEEGWEAIKSGTPVLILGSYDFDAPPPWRSVEWLARGVELPENPRFEQEQLAYRVEVDI